MESEAIWKKLLIAPAAQQLTSQEKDYLLFFRAMGRRDAVVMANMANKLLKSDSEITLARTKYLVAAGMLGYASAGKSNESVRLG